MPRLPPADIPDHSDPVVPPEAPTHPIFVENAGLVIVGAYLPVLFDRLSLLTPDAEGRPRIEGVEACSRAVHLLQYLVDGRLDTPEALLPLNKLLCGIPIAAPVASSWDADPADLEICDGLLAAIIANWPALGSSSSAGLRETFLQRQGRLLHSEGSWSLLVERKGLIDCLLDRINWSIGMIFHRWMSEPLSVTW